MRPLFRRGLRAAFVTCVAVALAHGCAPRIVSTTISPGLKAQNYLTSTAYGGMAVEVVPVRGYAPETAALNLMKLRASERCFKPDGIQILVAPEVAQETSTAHAWSIPDLMAFEAAHRQLRDGNGVATLFVEYLDGQYAGDAKAIGISYSDHSIAVFKDVLGPGGPEGSVLVHELGHQLGLVDGTSPMQIAHEDPTSRGHDASPSCVMYFALSSAVPGTNMGPPDDYCSNCKADMHVAGGR